MKAWGSFTSSPNKVRGTQQRGQRGSGGQTAVEWVCWATVHAVEDGVVPDKGGGPRVEAYTIITPTANSSERAALVLPT
jgi:hypothetical protein